MQRFQMVRVGENGFSFFFLFFLHKKITALGGSRSFSHVEMICIKISVEKCKVAEDRRVHGVYVFNLRLLAQRLRDRLFIYVLIIYLFFRVLRELPFYLFS